MAEKHKQYWLILSHCFNMDGRAASITITDKLPYLEAAGITPIILSGVSGERDKKYHHEQLLPWGPSGFRFDVRHVLANHFGRGLRYRILWMIMSLILAPFILIARPLLGWQNQWSWAIPATIRSLWLIYRYRPAILYSTGGAYSAHLAGDWIKRLTGIKWIAEIHDPMVQPGTIPGTRNEKFMAYIEGLVCKNSDLAWWFTTGALEGARVRHPELGNRGKIILPGVEKPTITGEYQRGTQMIISHFGSISDTRSMIPVVNALHDLLQRKPEMRPNIRVHIYGGTLDRKSKVEIARCQLEDVFINFGRLEKNSETGLSGRDQVVQRMFQSDCLLLLHGTVSDCREYIPSKLYEYLWARRPVIALTYQNPQLDQMITERGGYLAHADQPVEVMQVIEQAYSDWQNNRLPISNLPAIGVEQAVKRILEEVSLL
jgi:glycosyltransferase involved in cell wall biosynthesis